MTAQHAWRQGRVAGENVAASLAPGPVRRTDPPDPAAE
jgi:NADH dehydrogenase FAD-containing subunit